jgi:hypothetical protein
MKIEKYQKKGAAFEFKERQEYFKGQFKALALNNFWVKTIGALVIRAARPSSAKKSST